MSENMIGTCEVCQKPVPRECMTYFNYKLYHPDCFVKIKDSIPPPDESTIAKQELRDQLQRELQGFKIQLAQLKNRAIRSEIIKSQSSKSSKKKSTKKKKRKSTKKKKKRTSTKRKRTTKRRKKSTRRKPVRKSRIKSKRKTRRKAVRRVSRRKKKAKRRR